MTNEFKLPITGINIVVIGQSKLPEREYLRVVRFERNGKTHDFVMSYDTLKDFIADE